jgi:hypothetical protein
VEVKKNGNVTAAFAMQLRCDMIIA